MGDKEISNNFRGINSCLEFMLISRLVVIRSNRIKINDYKVDSLNILFGSVDWLRSLTPT